MLTEGTSSNSADCVSETNCWGVKKGSLQKAVSLSSCRGKWSLLFCFSVCAQVDFPHEQQSAALSALCQGLSFYILRMLNTCLVASKVLQTSLVVSGNYRKWRGHLELTAAAFVWPGSWNQPCLMNRE